MKVSIVIPSRERGPYLEHSLRSVTAIEDPDIEILVSDNASLDNTRAVVEANPDPRIRYVNTGARLSMRQNFEFALRESTGDYLIYIGDDDGVLPGQFPVLRRILSDKRPDTVSWPLPTYGWPVEGFGRKTGGVRFQKASAFGRPAPLDGALRLRQLEQGMCDQEPLLPCLYHGCMSRAFLDRIAGEGVPYFRARSPDVYISYRGLQHGGNFWSVRHPITLNGFSPASTGGAMQTLGNEEDESKSDQRFLTEIKADDVDDIVPVTQSMSLAFLGTLETARYHYPEDIVTPDYVPWYRRVLMDAARKDPETAAAIRISLEQHAAQFGAEAAHAEALRLGPPSARRTVDKLRQVWGKRHSFRRVSEIGGENTIATAAQMCDRIFGDDAMRVINGETSANAAWNAARRRARDFEAQL